MEHAQRPEIDHVKVRRWRHRIHTLKAGCTARDDVDDRSPTSRDPVGTGRVGHDLVDLERGSSVAVPAHL